MNTHIREIRKRPPPPHLPIRNVLLCCLFLILFLAVPIASQAQTPVPTTPPREDNPTVMAPCGLPATFARFDTNATVKTFNMTADCYFNSWGTNAGSAFLFFISGEFTINGNGYRIIGPSNSFSLFVQFANTTLNLNNVTIQGSGGTNTVTVTSSATLNASRVIFQDNTNTSSPLFVSAAAQVNLDDVQFLGNTSGQRGVITANASGSSVVITNGVFRGNTAPANVVEARDGGAVRLEGCIVFESNVRTGGSTPASSTASSGVGSSVTNNSVSSGPVCLATTPQPKKKKKEKDPTPAPTSTPRPQIAATHVALQAATGATFGATFGLDSGVHFRQLDGAGIGIQSIIDAGYLEAFDVWGYVEQGVEVCFSQVGRVVFLDARTSPRAIVPLESTVVNGQTCVSINSPGSLVLLPN